MTNEQLNHYEALTKLVDSQYEAVLAKTMQLAGMSIGEGESSSSYVTRVNDKIDDINVAKMWLEQAKENKRAFVMQI
jgi:hypothetical protein